MLNEKMTESRDGDSGYKRTLELPNLRTLSSESLYWKEVESDPLGSLRSVRTVEELLKVIDLLTKGEISEPDFVESLIMCITKSELYWCHSTKGKLMSWYGKDSTSSVQQLVRSFRFLMETTYPDSSMGGFPITSRLCEWNSDIINRMIKNHHALYWFSETYQNDILWELSNFTRESKQIKLYNKHEWERISRAIRRLVDAGDYSLLPQITKLIDQHCNRKIAFEAKSDGDRFEPALIRAFLNYAVKLLKNKKHRDEMGASRTHDGLTFNLGDTTLALTGLPRVITVKNKEVDVRLEVNITFSSPITENRTYTVSIDGGYFPGKEEPYSISIETGERPVKIPMICYLGKHRLTITIHSSNRKLVNLTYHFEVKTAEAENAPAAAT